MLRADLGNARKAWLDDAATPMERAEREATSFLCYVDAQGRYADFHALRHTTGTWLAAAGVHPKIAQSLMRHSTINLTMNTYSHVLVGQEVDAIENLPSLGIEPVSQREKKTGTNDVPVTPLTPPAPENKRVPKILHPLGRQGVAASGKILPASGGSLGDEKRRNPNKIVDSVEVSSDGSGRIRTSVGRSPTDLQSVPFGHSGTLPSSGKNVENAMNPLSLTEPPLPVHSALASKLAFLAECSPLSTAENEPADANLVTLLRAWDSLPDAVKASIATLVKATAPKP